jgi:AcrR family transcriptional regulator
MARHRPESVTAITGPAGPEGTAPMVERPPAPRQRQPPEIRRQMIIAAAREVIGARGMHATTVRDIAAAAQVAVGTVTYHFSGIAEVLAGVLEAEMAEYSAPVMAAVAGAPTGRDGLLLLTDGLLATGDRAVQHWKLWLDFWTLAAHHQHYSDWQSQVYRDLHGLAAMLLRRGGADGTLAVADPDRQAIEYIAMMDGLVVQGYLPGARLDPDRAREMLRGYLAAAFATP